MASFAGAALLAIPHRTNFARYRLSTNYIHIWEGRKVPTKSLFEQEAPKIDTKCSTKGGVREPLHVEFALNNRELVKAEVFEKKMFEQTTPLK